MGWAGACVYVCVCVGVCVWGGGGRGGYNTMLITRKRTNKLEACYTFEGSSKMSIPLNTYSRVSQFLYLAKNIRLASERYTAEIFCLYKAWILIHTKLLYSYAKLIALWGNACILHDTGLEFCQATVSSTCMKRIIHMYILTGKVHPKYTPLAIN